MNNNFNFKPVVVALMVLMPSVAAGMQKETIKEFRKEFPADQHTKLEIQNKYGNVDIKDWGNPSISIEVKVIVRSENLDKAEKILGCISINFKQEGNTVQAFTEFSNDLSSVFRDFNDDEKNLEINYSVFMPKTVPLSLVNKYGGVFINELASTSTIDVKYGKLTANKIIHDAQQPLTQIILGYSNATIQECKWIKVDIKYSKLQISQSKAIIFLSKYSKIYIDNATSLVCESKYDTYELGRLSNLVATTGYSHFSARELTNKLQIESKYTDVSIEQVPADFEQIKVENSYGSYKIAIAPEASYRIEGNARYCKIIYPEDNAKVSRFNENTDMKVSGLIGKNEATRSSVILNSSYGNIRLLK